MSATFSTHTRSYSANAFIDSLKISDIQLWKANTNYSVGANVYYASRRYVAAQSGISGTFPPTHALGSYSDGSINWIFVEKLNVDNNFKNNVYMFYGKTTEWADEANPDSPVANELAEYDILSDIIACKRVSAISAKIATRRFDWTPGTFYSQYDPAKDPLSLDDYPIDRPFYVITQSFDIYKCLDNNNGAASFSEPTGTSLEYIKLIDGYVWFYMGSLSAYDSLMMSPEFFPVDSKTFDDGSEQYQVQVTSKPGSISTFKLKGMNSIPTQDLSVTVYGEGQNATAEAIVNGATISQVLVVNRGMNYKPRTTYAMVKNASAVGSGAEVSIDIFYNSIKPNVVITDPGTGYVTPPSVTMASFTGYGAQFTAVLGTPGSINEGKVVQIVVDNPGKNYSVNDVLIIVGGNGTGASAQVQIDSTGIIGNVSVVSGMAGSDYTTCNIVIVGDGTGALATGTINNGSLDSITISNHGTGYTHAVGYVIPGEFGAIAYPVMAPVTGHGFNIAAELACNTALLNIKVNSNTDLNYFPVSAEFRQVGLICNIVDNDTGADCTKEMYIGPKHPNYPGVNPQFNKLKEHIGYVLYLNNIPKTIRSALQEEEIRIAIQF